MRFSFHSLPLGEIKLFHSAVPPGHREYNAHHHTVLEISFILSGEGTYRTRDKEISFCSGDLFLFGADEPHCVTFISDKEHFELLNIHFESRLLWAGSDGSMLPLLRLFNDRPSSLGNKISSALPEAKCAAEQIYEAEREFLQKPTGYEIRIRLLLYSLLLDLYRSFFDGDSSKQSAPPHDNLSSLSDAVKFMDAHFTEEINLSEIARQAHLSRTYFCTLFKKYNGISPFEYITIKRVEKAIEYLKTTSLSKLEIAALSGFSSSSNFYKAFYKVTGKKPGDYIF